MDIQHVKGIGKARKAKLANGNVHTLEDLARANVDDVAAATGLKPELIREYKEKATALCLLQDLKGVGPATLRQLVDSGIDNLKDLGDASVERLQREGKLAREKASEIGEEARKLLRHIGDEAKTAEGRRHLVEEGRELAHRAKVGAVEGRDRIVRRSQDLAGAGIAKARHIQETAPQAIHDIQDRVVGMVHGMEARVRRAAGRAQSVVGPGVDKVKQGAGRVKAEVQKVRAANTGAVAKMTANDESEE